MIMVKVAVVYWSGTGNTEAMAALVAEGAKEKRAEPFLKRFPRRILLFLIRPGH